MVSTTRPISCRTDDSRSGVFSLPWKYFDATMLVAVWDQVLGTSTFSWRKIVWPFSLLIWAVRRSHATASKGETLPSAKNRRNSSPVFAWVERGGSKGGSVFPVVVFWFSAIFVCAIAASAQEGFPMAGEPVYFTPKCEPGGPQRLILRQAPLNPEENSARDRNTKKTEKNIPQ